MKAYIVLLVGFIVLFNSCNDSKYDLDNIVPNEYHKILYISNSGKQKLILYDTGEDFVYSLSVFKSGSNPKETADVDLSVMSQEQLDLKYSTPEAVEYKVIPEDCYSFDSNKLLFASGDRFNSVNISINTNAVKELLDDNTAVNWVLPVVATSNTDSINANKNIAFLQIADVITPTTGFVINDNSIEEYDFGTAFTVTKDIEISLSTDNKWNIECELSVDNDYIEEYNLINKSSYQAFPEGSYSFPEIVVLSSGTTKELVNVNIDGTKFITPGDYMLPINIKNVSEFAISTTNRIYPLVIRIKGNEFDRSKWRILSDSEETSGEPAPNGPAINAIDGNLDTYWHSTWKENSFGRKQLPYELIIDMNSICTVTQIGMIQRGNGYTDVKDGKIYVSNDSEAGDWKEVGSFIMQQNMEKQLFSVLSTQCRYVRVVIESSYRQQYCSLSEIYAYGMTD